MSGWKDILRRHGVTYIVTKTMDSSGMILPLIPVLANDPEWGLVFADGLFVIFVVNTPENQVYLQKFGISKRILPRQVISEAYHYMYLGVSPLVAYQTITNMYLSMGDRPAAIRALREGLDVMDNPYLRNQLLRLEQSSGHP